MKCLVFEERSDMLKFLLSIVECFGYKAGIAENNLEIIPMLADDRYDIVLTNGGYKDLDLGRHIRSEFPSVYVICITGSRNLKRNMNSAIDHYLMRPFEISKLRQILETPLNQQSPIKTDTA